MNTSAVTVPTTMDETIPAVVARAPEIDGTRMSGGAYRVRRGDTLSNIARRYRTSALAIAGASGIRRQGA